MDIKTQHLLLRDFQVEDLQPYHELRADKKFQRFYGEEAETLAYSQTLLNLFMEQAREHPRKKYQLAITTEANNVIGSCGMRVESPGVGSMGCELGRRWHGKGYAKEAGLAMLDFAFSELKLERLYAETNEKNLSAIRLSKSLGFALDTQKASTQYFKGQQWTTVTLNLSSKDWVNSKSTGFN